jgi:hypothetical protein
MVVKKAIFDRRAEAKATHAWTGGPSYIRDHMLVRRGVKYGEELQMNGAALSTPLPSHYHSQIVWGNNVDCGPTSGFKTSLEVGLGATIGTRYYYLMSGLTLPWEVLTWHV